MKIDYKKLAEMVTDKRTKNHMTQRDVAKMTGMSNSSISLLENGLVKDMAVSSLFSICTWLNKPVSHFIIPSKLKTNGKNKKGKA